MPAARASEAATGARLLAASSGAADCATAGADMANVAAVTHKTPEAKNIPLDGRADLNTDRTADTNDEHAKRGDKEGGKCDKREPRRLRDKEVGNVVDGQRNMPEILSPCG